MPKNKGYIYNWDEIPLCVDAYYVADLLKCSARLIRDECQRGKLKAFKVGDMWRIRKDDLIAYTQGTT